MCNFVWELGESTYKDWENFSKVLFALQWALLKHSYNELLIHWLKKSKLIDICLTKSLKLHVIFECYIIIGSNKTLSKSLLFKEFCSHNHFTSKYARFLINIQPFPLAFQLTKFSHQNIVLYSCYFALKYNPVCLAGQCRVW